MNKIAEIPKIKQELLKISKIAKKNLTFEQKEINNQYKEYLMLPDKFNEYFTKNCWIAHEYFDSDMMNKSINIYQKNKSIKEVEYFLSDIYDEEFINQRIEELKCFQSHNLDNIQTLFIKYFLERKDIIEIAKNDYLNERYYSCIPLLLSIIDGVTNDIDHEFGFFTKHSDLIVENSIVGHERGLQSIKKIINQSRKKTNSERITIPYRNGILHGRDINYGNKIVAAKCWHILFALKDWAKDNNIKNFTVENRKPITREEIEKNIPKEFDLFVNNLFENLKNSRNDQLIFFSKYPTNDYSKHHRMNELGRLFKGINFLDFTVLSEEIYKNNLKVLKATATFEINNKKHKKEVTFLIEYLTIDNKLISTKNKNGFWKTDLLLTFNNISKTMDS